MGYPLPTRKVINRSRCIHDNVWAPKKSRSIGWGQLSIGKKAFMRDMACPNARLSTMLRLRAGIAGRGGARGGEAQTERGRRCERPPITHTAKRGRHIVTRATHSRDPVSLPCEEFVNHWDGACAPNDYYVLFKNSTHYLLSSGMDQTFQCLPEMFFPHRGDRDRVYTYESCGVGYECVRTPKCRALYETHLANLRMTPGLRETSCDSDWVLYVVLSMVIGTLFPLLVLLAPRAFTTRSKS